MKKSAEEMTPAQRVAHNREQIEKLRRCSKSPERDPNDGVRLARVMMPGSRTCRPIEEREERLKYAGGKTGEEI